MGMLYSTEELAWHTGHYLTLSRYKRAAKSKNAAAASYRNSAFLVVPQSSSTKVAIPRSPSRSISQDPEENRSFEYFQLHTLPMWTEFFPSELWSRTILQLSHAEPAIRHGILALSTMHARYESITPLSTPNAVDAAFLQYTQAVNHSNALLRAHQAGKVSLDMVLIACIIFTSYENVAGNYRAASMHLKNGLRILDQNRNMPGARKTALQDDIANVLYRLDVQAMTFSDNASNYEYRMDEIPACPEIPPIYLDNSAARDDLVGILRCMMWAMGIIEEDHSVAQDPQWYRVHDQILSALNAWDVVFETYRQSLTTLWQHDPKIYAGNTLLRISALTIRTIVGAKAGVWSEMAWDAYLDNFTAIVDLAETIPLLKPQSRAPSLSRGSSPAPYFSPLPHGGDNQAFDAPPDYHSSSSFSPSFELSPIVPLFVVACRCRDPTTRRRAITLLLRYRRREGVWDSLGAGMVAAQCMKKEEALSSTEYLNFEDPCFLARNPGMNFASDVPEYRRVRNVSVEVKIVQGRIDLEYSMTTGEKVSERQIIYESRGDRGVWRDGVVGTRMEGVDRAFDGGEIAGLEI